MISSNINLPKKFRVEQALYKKCHCKIICGTLNFNIPLLPPYIRKLSDFKNANIEFVQKSINYFDWTGLFKVKIAMNNAKST